MSVGIQSEEVFYCKRCVVSNQRPRITFNAEGICNACLYAERKRNEIDWSAREHEFQTLLDQYRSKDGSWDVIVPCSGGKDSSTIAHILKHQYGMHPLTVTWAPNIYTDIGRINLQKLIDAGFDNILGQPNGQVNRKMVRLAFEHLGDPFQPFIYGVEAFPLRIAVTHNIPLVMYAEDGEVEYGGSTKNEDSPTVDIEDITNMFFSGIAPDDWMEWGVSMEELQPYMMPSVDQMVKAELNFQHFAYYKKWIPQENYYYAAENIGFQANPERNEGTYSKYASIDDKLDGFHYWLGFIKFGIGRTTSDAAHEIRDRHLTREEGVALVQRYDGEFPKKYFKDFLEYIDISEDRFWEVVDSFRRPHIWEQVNGVWQLRHQVS